MNSIFSNREPEKKGSVEKYSLMKLAISFGGFLFGSIALLISHGAIPTWTIYIVVLYLAIMLIGVVYSPVKKVLSAIQQCRHSSVRPETGGHIPSCGSYMCTVPRYRKSGRTRPQGFQ
jgi:hypothetical protein